MPSLQSRLFVFAMRNRHLLQGRLKPQPPIDWNTSMVALRAETEKGSGLMGKLPEDIVIEPVQIGTLYAEWVTPKGAARDKVILYFHGGGYVIGSCLGHRAIVSKFVKNSGTPAMVFNYALAPEHPFPAALNDAVAAYQWLLKQDIDPKKVVFVGDSAGGGLCLAVLLALRDQNIPLPGGAVAMSPWTDLKNTGPSYETNQKVDMLTWRGSQEVFSKYYVGDQDPGNPWISPLYGDLRGLPPLQIYVGNDELLRDDSTRFAEKAQAAGVAVKLTVGEGLFHCYPACAPLFPEAVRDMNEICAFIRRI